MKNIKFAKKHLNTFKKLGIETIYLFGSHAQGNTHPLSDIDIGVVFSKPEKYKDNTMSAYSKLYNVFADVLPKEYLKKRFKMRAHEFDLVFLQFAPFSLQFNAIRDAKVLYEKDEEERLNYQEYVVKRNADFEYFNNLRHQAILQRIWKNQK